MLWEVVLSVVLIAGAASPILLGLFFFIKRVTSDWEGYWKVVAWLPFFGMLGLAIDMGFKQGSLWPIALLFWGVVAFAAVAVLSGIGAFVRSFWQSYING